MLPRQLGKCFRIQPLGFCQKITRLTLRFQTLLGHCFGGGMNVYERNIGHRRKREPGLVGRIGHLNLTVRSHHIRHREMPLAVPGHHQLLDGCRHRGILIKFSRTRRLINRFLLNQLLQNLALLLWISRFFGD